MLLQQKICQENKKEEVKSEISIIIPLPWCKKVAAKNLKKGHAEKDVKSNWAAKASCFR